HLTTAEEDLLVPARTTRNKARRLFLRISIPDGRTGRKYRALNGVAELRIQFRAAGTYARLTAPTRGERPESEEKALELLLSLQHAYCTLYVGAARDSKSEVFRESLRSALAERFSSALVPPGPGV